MRTRSRVSLGLASPPPSSPPPTTKDSNDFDEISIGTHISLSAIDNYSNPSPPITPRKSGKRVRFSDPGPTLSTTQLNSRSSGLTPHLRRSTLSPSSTRTDPRYSRGSKRKLSDAAFPTPDLTPSSDIDLLQFTPLKQSLDARTRRRLRRNHLSEECNEWEQQHRADARDRRELMQLRDDYAQKEEQVRLLTLDVELQRQLGISLGTEDEQVLDTLRRELAEVKEMLALQEQQQQQEHGNTASPQSASNFTQLNDAVLQDWEAISAPSSPTLQRRRFDSASLNLSTCTGKEFTTLLDVGCQAALTDSEHQTQVARLQEIILQLSTERSDVQAAYTTTRDELHAMGFSPSHNEQAVEGIPVLREAFRSARLELERLLPGETLVGFDNGKILLDSLLDHVKALLEKSRATEKAVESYHQRESALRRQFNAALCKMAELENSIAEIMQHRTQLISKVEAKQQELEHLKDELLILSVEGDTSHTRNLELEASQRNSALTIERLQNALKSYETEMSSFESLIASLEEDKHSLSAALGNAMQESDERAQELEQRNQQLNASYERRVAELDNDVARAEEEVKVDREKLHREKSVFEQRMNEMRQRCAELEETKRGHDTVIGRLKETNEGLETELRGIRERFNAYGSVSQDMLENACRIIRMRWAEEQDYLTTAKQKGGWDSNTVR